MTTENSNTAPARKIENIVDLRQDLTDIYQQLRGGQIGIREAKEIANVAGKIIGSVKIQLEYNVYTKTKERIPFLETTPKNEFSDI